MFVKKRHNSLHICVPVQLHMVCPDQMDEDRCGAATVLAPSQDRYSHRSARRSSPCVREASPFIEHLDFH